MTDRNIKSRLCTGVESEMEKKRKYLEPLEEDGKLGCCIRFRYSESSHHLFDKMREGAGLVAATQTRVLGIIIT